MVQAFITAVPLSTTTSTVTKINKCSTTSMAAAEETVEKYYPAYRRDRAPKIVISPDTSVSVAMSPVDAFTTIDKSEPSLLDYSNPSDFVVKKSTSPSAISWPSGDGRSDPDFVGVPSQFDQPNLKSYGPFPDFSKVCFYLFLFE